MPVTIPDTIENLTLHRRFPWPVEVPPATVNENHVSTSYSISFRYWPIGKPSITFHITMGDDHDYLGAASEEVSYEELASVLGKARLDETIAAMTASLQVLVDA